MTRSKMATAQGSWKEGENWKVVTPEGDLIFDLKGKFDETMVMQAIRLARFAEADSFNEGVRFQKKVSEATESLTVAQLKADIKSLVFMNNELSEQLDMMISKGK